MSTVTVADTTDTRASHSLADCAFMASGPWGRISVNRVEPGERGAASIDMALVNIDITPAEARVVASALTQAAEVLERLELNASVG